MSIPCDPEAERAVLGIALQEDPVVLPAALGVLDPGDFHIPSHGTIWRAISGLYGQGKPTDRLTVGEELRAMGQVGVVPLLDGLVGAHVPLASRMPHYCGIVVAQARRRALHRAGRALVEAAEAGVDPDEILDTLTASLAEAERADPDQLPDRLSTVAEFLERPGEKRADWVIPGLLRRDWRAVLVAPEGLGKSVVLRSLAGYAAQGIHPFTAEQIAPCRALVVDLENPDEPIDDTFRRIGDTLRQRDPDPDRAWLWRHQEGLDIRTRMDQRRFERVLQHTRPDLVCIGPAYKLFTAKKGEDFEQVSAEVFAALDSLRTRYGFALAMEHHAPHGDRGGRELRPFGSSAWLRWPELGLTLDPADAEAHGWPTGHLLKVGRFRFDRVKHCWPRWITRGRQLLWVGHYETEPPPATRRTA